MPGTRELFTAIAGQGALLNGAPIRCSTTVSAANTPWSPPGSRTSSIGGASRAGGSPRSSRRIRDVRRFGAASTDLCHVAAGRLDVYYEQWLGPWDWAAAN